MKKTLPFISVNHVKPGQADVSDITQTALTPTVKNARVAGAIYLLSGITAFLSLYLSPTLIVSGNATATANNILASEMLFRIGIVSELISAIAFVFAVRALYRLLNGVNKTHASLMVTFVLVSVPISFLNVLNEIAALMLMHGANFMTMFDQLQLDALAMVFLNLHSQGIDVVQIFWGLWLFPFGVLVYRSGFIPRILGVFLIAAGFAIVSNSLVPLLLLPYGNVVNLVATALDALGELSMVAWLLIKGVKVQRLAVVGP